jgi:replicative DNA helicase
MEQSKEILILRNLIFNEDYSKRVLPHLKPEYFRENSEKVVFETIQDYITKYATIPTLEAVSINLAEQNLYDSLYEDSRETLKKIESGKDNKINSEDWLIDETEKFCKEKALFNAATETVSIFNDPKKNVNVIPQLFQQALGISFDPSVGHDYLEDAESRYDELHKPSKKLAFDIDICNQVTKGGVEKGTLNVIAAGVYVGKTLALCHLTTSYLKANKNVLYITLEISQANIAGYRIDCNLLNITTDEAETIPKDVFLKKVARAKQDIKGKLIVKEYPNGSINVNNIRALLHELKLKKGFVPDVILVDYLNLLNSVSVKNKENSHIHIQAVAEELRSLAQEQHLPIWSATQLNAEGMNSSDPGMTDISGSKVGLSATLDLLWMAVSNDKLRELGQLLIIQHKNRYKDISDMKKFYVGLDRKKMRWYNCEQKVNARLMATTNDDEEIEPPSEEDEKLEISKQHGSEAYKPAYKNGFTAKFGPRSVGKPNFNDFKI